MTQKSFPLSKVYSLLESGPVIMVTTAHGGQRNVMPMSWHMMVDFEPPLVGFVMSDRNHSFAMLRDSGECVIAIPTLDIADKVIGCGNCSGAKIDKFAEFGLETLAAGKVKPPLLGECFANLECRVVNTDLVDLYGLFVVEVLEAHLDSEVKEPRTIHHLGKENFMVAGDRIKLKSKMK